MSTPDPAALGREVLGACRALGFALAGIAPAQRSDREAELRAWLHAGKHGEMAYMTELLDQRLDITAMLPGARSVIIVADRYAPAASDPPPPPGHLRVARYARGSDYHAVIKRRLHRVADELRRRFPRDEFRSFVDTGPVLEREHAARAGLGWIGKHTLLINPELGSYLLLGGIATTLALHAPDTQPDPIPDHCGTCSRCIDACPTHAISPYSVDARKCISYLTIEHAGPLDPDLAAKLSGWIFGCDICQEVCPYNAPDSSRAATDTRAIHPAYRQDRGVGAVLSIEGIAHWTPAEHRRDVSGSALKRATLAMLQRNAKIV